MDYTGIVQDVKFAIQYDQLVAQYPRLNEVWECADWQIGKSHSIFPEAHRVGNRIIRIWRSDGSDIDGLPSFEIAFYYDTDDGRIHYMGIRPILNCDE